jgi:hypothetical protein
MLEMDIVRVDHRDDVEATEKLLWSSPRWAKFELSVMLFEDAGLSPITRFAICKDNIHACKSEHTRKKRHDVSARWKAVVATAKNAHAHVASRRCKSGSL